MLAVKVAALPLQIVALDGDAVAVSAAMFTVVAADVALPHGEVIDTVYAPAVVAL